MRTAVEDPICILCLGDQEDLQAQSHQEQILHHFDYIVHSHRAARRD